VEWCEEWGELGVPFIASRGLNGRGWAVASANRRARADVRAVEADDVAGHTSHG
jgi:hypothetical protein